VNYGVETEHKHAYMPGINAVSKSTITNMEAVRN